MANPNRRKLEPRHIRLYHWITGTAAWRALSGNAIKVLLALVRLDDGTRNGQIFFSDRQAATETGLSRNTCIRALAELVEKGFLRVVEKGHFDRKVRHATVWRYTWQAAPGFGGPTRDFEKWKPDTEKSRAQILIPTGANTDKSASASTATGANNGPDKAPKPQKSFDANVSKFEPQVVYHKGAIQ